MNNIDIDEKDKLLSHAVSLLQEAVCASMSDNDWTAHKKFWQHKNNWMMPSKSLHQAWEFLLNSFYESDLPLDLQQKDDILKKSIQNINTSLWNLNDGFAKRHGSINEYCLVLSERVSQALQDNINKISSVPYHTSQTQALKLSRLSYMEIEQIAIHQKNVTKQQFLNALIGSSPIRQDSIKKKEYVENLKNKDWNDVIAERMKKEYNKNFIKIAQNNLDLHESLLNAQKTLAKKTKDYEKIQQMDERVQYFNNQLKKLKK